MARWSMKQDKLRSMTQRFGSRTKPCLASGSLTTSSRMPSSVGAAQREATKQPSVRWKQRYLAVEANGWRIAAPIRRIWGGDRDWHELAETLDCDDALLILLILGSCSAIFAASSD